mgnify:CR=1 FL=1
MVVAVVMVMASLVGCGGWGVVGGVVLRLGVWCGVVIVHVQQFVQVDR